MTRTVYAGAGAAARTAVTMRQVIPLYVYPSFAGSDWDTVAASDPAGMVIANPNTGPGASVNSDYTAGIDAVREAGGQVLGYVALDAGSGPGTRALADVLADVDAWYDFYPQIDGVFYDIAPTGANGDKRGYFAAVCEYARSKAPGCWVVVNPGTYPLTDDYVAPADVVCVWEGDYTANSYAASSVPGYATYYADFPPTKWLHLVYGVDDAATMRAALAHAKQVGARWFHASTITGSVWDDLAAYHVEQVTALNAARVEVDPLDRALHHGPVRSSDITNRSDAINVRAYGAVGDGTTDDAPTIQALIDNTPLGTPLNLYFPPGTYRITALDVSGKRNITFRGDLFGRPGATTIQHTGTSGDSVITGTSVEGFRVAGLAFWASNAAYTGRFFDFRGGQAYHIAVEDCFFGGAGDLWTAIDAGSGYNHTYVRNNFYRCGTAIFGNDLAAVPAEATQSVTVRENHFSALVKTAHIVNPGAGWEIHGNSVEPMSTGNPAFVTLTTGNDLRDVSISGNWCGDVTTGSGVHIQVRGTGIFIAHNLFGLNATTKAVQAVGNTDGLVVLGNRQSGAGAALVDWGAHSHSRPVVLGNSDSGGTWFAGTVPATLVAQAAGSTEGLLLGHTHFRNTSQLRFYNAADSAYASLQADSAGALVYDSLSGGNISNRLTGTGTFQAFRVEGFNGSTYDILFNLRRALCAVSTDLSVNVAGKGLQVKEGSNAKQGTATLVAGAVTVSNTSVTASSRILLTIQSPGGTPGSVYVSARSAGVSFTITSTSGADTSTVAYQIFEPAA